LPHDTPPPAPPTIEPIESAKPQPNHRSMIEKLVAALSLVLLVVLVIIMFTKRLPDRQSDTTSRSPTEAPDSSILSFDRPNSKLALDKERLNGLIRRLGEGRAALDLRQLERSEITPGLFAQLKGRSITNIRLRSSYCDD